MEDFQKQLFFHLLISFNDNFKISSLIILTDYYIFFLNLKISFYLSQLIKFFLVFF